MSETREIYCCGCETEVEARLTDGREVYPFRSDLPFWKCPVCGNFVGCHTGEIRSIEEARDVYRAVREIKEGLS